MKPYTTFKTKPILGAFLAVTPIFVGANVLAQTGTNAVAQMDTNAPAAQAPTPFVTGTLSLMGETHFISYGQDVWGAGSSWEDLLFHPSLELDFDLGAGFTGIAGSWWDVNNNAPSNIGNRIQEVDVWFGAAYAIEKWKFTLLYQEWMYASQVERILDFKVAFTHWLNPNLTVHNRLGGAEPFDKGTVVVVGIAPGKTFGPVTLSFPANISYDTENFHGGDSGLGFVNVGANAAIPLSFIPRGNWTYNIGVTYWHTDKDTIPVNPDTDFLVGSMGITLTF